MFKIQICVTREETLSRAVSLWPDSDHKSESSMPLKHKSQIPSILNLHVRIHHWAPRATLWFICWFVKFCTVLNDYCYILLLTTYFLSSWDCYKLRFSDPVASVCFSPDDNLGQVAKSCLIGACLLKPGACCDWQWGRQVWELNVLSNQALCHC